MSDHSEFSRNKAALDHCNMIYKWIFIILFLGGAASVVYTLYQSTAFLVTLNIAGLVALCVGGLVIVPLSLGANIYSGYRRIDMYAYLAPVIALLSAIMDLLCGCPISIVSILGVILTVVFAAPTILTNSRYRYLEMQEGFPYFSELLMEQQLKSEEFKLHDPYAEAAEQRKLTQSDSMNDLELNGEVIEDKVNEKTNYMDEI